MPDAHLSYEVVDVFTSRPFAGNPLAVVYGAEDLTTEQLQAIAVEFNLSETTFPVALTGADRETGADYRVRIFTPTAEIPFAGHPTIGTAWSLRQRGMIGTGQRLQSCRAGLIGVAVPADPTDALELSAVPRDHARRLSAAETATAASLVGLGADDVVGPAYAAGCGLSWLYLQVVPPAVAKARPTGRKVIETDIDLAGILDPLDGVDVFALASAGPGSGATLLVSSRVFLPGYGIPEDPATGSAAVGLGLVLVAAGHAVADGVTRYRIDQGVDMGRPSVLAGRVEASDGTAVRSHVAGQIVPVSSGQIVVPPLTR